MVRELVGDAGMARSTSAKAETEEAAMVAAAELAISPAVDVVVMVEHGTEMGIAGMLEVVVVVEALVVAEVSVVAEIVVVAKIAVA
eukprot:394650-Pleurochrysis_carterae.AAC.1